MAAILCGLIVFFSATTVWAEDERYIDWVNRQNNGKCPSWMKAERCFVYMDPAMGLQWLPSDTSCLDKMEKAMKAMAPFLLRRLPESPTKEESKAVVLWENTKRDCFRNP